MTTPAPNSRERPRVAVCVDLERSARSGGQVRFWEKLAHAAARAAPAFDLTVHVQGRRYGVEALAPHVRFVAHRPVLSTQWLGLSPEIPDHTDLAPFHPGLWRQLAGADVIHTTDAYFAYARTAAVASRRLGARLVNSIHTDTPAYTRLYSERLIRRCLGDGALARLAIERWRWPERLGAGMTRKLDRHLALCDHVLITAVTDRSALAGGIAEERISVMRRGIDKQLFSPEKRDRAKLRARYGVPEDAFVLAFVGRIDSGKSAMTLAEAARRLLPAYPALAVLMVGEGADAPRIRALLGDRACLPGTLEGEALAHAYASADAFVFPSRVEFTPNVVLEAKASGLPVLVAPASRLYVRRDGIDGVIIPEIEPEAWAQRIAALIEDGAMRGAMARAARADVVEHEPSWDDVLTEDVLPAWRQAMRRVARTQARPHSVRTPSPLEGEVREGGMANAMPPLPRRDPPPVNAGALPTSPSRGEGPSFPQILAQARARLRSGS
ncbi:MAG TPA: glycosyltransferase [Stellaceae bacterium]|nr:glycosyltransferase [Stellaceae bacterium]